MSRLEGREAGAKHRAEGEPRRWRPRRGHALIINYFITFKQLNMTNEQLAELQVRLSVLRRYL